MLHVSAMSDHPTESVWGPAIAVIVALGLQLALPEKLVIGPRWILPALEVVLLAPLVLAVRRRHQAETRWARRLSIALIAVINLANVVALVLLTYYLIHGGKAGGQQLIFSAIAIWMTNVLIFGLWYWELDRGGPAARMSGRITAPEFLYPQMTHELASWKDWRPTLVDYMYVSFTNATAFSPTDTMPLSRRAKALMSIQAMASLLTVALVAARAVNILS
jgi:hypothetical protein